MMSTGTKLPAHDVGSGNAFVDLGLFDAKEHQLKAVRTTVKAADRRAGD